MGEKISNSVRDSVVTQAKEVLAGNWVDLGEGKGFTRPADNLYPYQWNWDSGLIAYGYAHYDPERAAAELRSLFSGQWKNGFLPHIIFHDSKESREKKYTPGPEFWDCGDKVATSGLTQPPVHAMVVWHIYKQLRGKDSYAADEFLQEFYPKLFALHKYFYTKRDPEKWGLITIYHPWESGFDNSPRWDDALEAITPSYVPEYTRQDTDHVNKEHRPSDAHYDKYMFLAAELKKHGYDDKKIYPDHPFRIKDKVLSSILYASSERLLYIAETLNRTDDAAEIRKWMRRFEKNIVERLWNEEEKIFYDYDLVSEKLIPTRSVDGLIPMITGELSDQRVHSMLHHLDKADFCSTGVCSVGLVPSTDITDPSFHAEKYWRGPVWININWFLWKSFNRYDLTERALHLKQHTASLLSDQGFYEYYSPLDGRGLGAKNFSWTAALAIDMLEHS